MNSRTKILAIIDEHENGKEIAENIERVIRSWKDPEIYLLYVVDLSYLPPDIFASLDKKFYDKLRKKGSKVLNEVINELKDKRLNVKRADMYFGLAAEGILRYEREIKPDIIVIHERKTAIRKTIKGLPAVVLAKSKAPVFISG